MKKKKQELDEDDDQQNLEIIKAVAQAWHGHSTTNNTRHTNEFDAHRLKFKSKPSRFKLEAMSLNKSSNDSTNTSCGTSWDFQQSLWDSYEIVSVSKKLETGLLLDYRLDEPRLIHKRKESKNSLRNLLNFRSSRRFDEVSIPRDSS